MKKLFNIFRVKKEPKRFLKTNDTYDSELMKYTINGKEYAIIDSQIIHIQSVANDVQIYGWTLEFRYKDTRGEYITWSTYNNKIYVSRISALEAASKIYPSYRDEYEFRVEPLYKMNEPQYRDYKIDQLLTGKLKDTKVHEIKCWKVKEDCEITYEKSKSTYKYKKGNLFIQMKDGSIRLVKNSIEPNSTIYKKVIIDLIKSEQVDEVDIQNEKWAHPHLCKELKTKIKK